MYISELLSLFPADADIQINIINGPGSLTFIPSPGFYQENSHWKSMQALSETPVTRLNVVLEKADDKQVLLLMINEEDLK